MRWHRWMLSFFLLFALAQPLRAEKKLLTIASKNFTESYILAEIISQLLEHHGYTIIRKFGLGGTLICFESLKNGEIDVYPEYSGTIEQIILKSKKRLTYRQIQEAVSKKNFVFLESLGFNNTYAIAVPEILAQRYKLTAIEDLQNKTFRAVFSHEFLKREDGWPSLKETYHLSGLEVTGIEHSLAYEALKNKKAEIMDVYATDAKIKKFNLHVLKDNLNFFPQYNASPFLRAGLSREIYHILSQLKGKLPDEKMTELNSMAEHEKQSFAEIASFFLSKNGFTGKTTKAPAVSHWNVLISRTLRHLYLTFVALAMACFIAIPLGVFIYYAKILSGPVLMTTGLLQTIPSIALLAFMIPFFGIGIQPAIAALFLYSILPILRNTFAALNAISPPLKDAARGIGLYPYETLYYVELPLALPLIIAGVRTAAVINIGTATLAAFIGAGGLGDPIVTGLALNDTGMILEGAIPAALLAIFIEVLFEGIEMLFKRKFSVS